jgi:hypothetical protein
VADWWIGYPATAALERLETLFAAVQAADANLR